MCVVSMITEQWLNPLSPNPIPWTPTTPDPALAAQMLKVIELLERIDKKLDARECKVEAKQKAAFKRKLKRRAAQRR